MAEYNPNRPSETFDQNDYDALVGSTMLKGAASQMRFDSVEEGANFFARELDYIKAKTYDKVWPELHALSIFPVTHEAPEGAETITYYSFDEVGVARVIASYSDDLPRADIMGNPTTANIRSIGDSYGYNVQELRAARMAGRPLDKRKGEAAKKAIDHKINTIAFAGDSENGLMGVLSSDNNIPLYTLSTGAAGATDWAKKTAAEIMDDINGMFAYQAEITNDVERADTLALPPAVFINISTRQIPNTGLTVKKFILDNAPYLKKIESVSELGYKSTETNPYGKNVAFLYTNDKDKFSVEIPMPFYQYPVQTKNLEMTVPCEARMAGVIMYYPFSALIASGC